MRRYGSRRNMLVEHAVDLGEFVTELQSETDRGLPLVGAALIDEKLSKTLESFFVGGKSTKNLLFGANAPIGDLSSRVELCLSLGLIGQFEYQEIQIIRKIRNQFAHLRHGLTFDDEKIKGLCTSLKSPLTDGMPKERQTPRFRLINAIVCIVLRLFYRPEWVAKEQRVPKQWVPDSTWYNTNDTPPPENAGFVGLVSKSL
ncbi:transcriptional regulator [Vibrio parahaemolyticus]|nr:transcriptional regulator [Vibrio parahaemolyticus]